MSFDPINTLYDVIERTPSAVLKRTPQGFSCDSQMLGSWFSNCKHVSADITAEQLASSSEITKIDSAKVIDFLNQKEHAIGETNLLTTLQNGETVLRWCWLKSTPYLLIEDISQWHAEWNRLQIASYTDPLTGLNNRRRFHEDFERMHSQCLRSGQTGALILVDLDNFKTINDRLGHAVGDRILIEFGQRIKPLVRPYECLARIGGDEFAVITSHSGLEGANRIQRTLAKVLLQISASTKTQISASFGTALFGTQSATASPKWSDSDFENHRAEIFAQADADLYKLKLKKPQLNTD